MRKSLLFFVCSILFLIACKSEENKVFDGINVSGIFLPEVVECETGAVLEFRVIGSNGPMAGDKVQLVAQQSHVMEIDEIGDGTFRFTLLPQVYSGDYVFKILRGEVCKRVGTFKLLVSTGIEIDPEGATVYGQVACEGEGIEGVVVSDGIEVTTTDADGIYRLKSSKKHGYVFISSPSGYEPLNDGVLPRIHKLLTNGADVAERKDFTLLSSPGQENHTMLIFGDIHLANRNNDRRQFSDFILDVNDFVATSGKKTYAMTLGDMVWDLYWMTNSYCYEEYLRDMERIKGLTVWQTIGNHDHSMYFTGDFYSVAEYKIKMAPTYYSFNIGGVHYVVLDDVECTNRKATQDGLGNPCYERDYNGVVTQEILDWLAKDLEHVDSSTPLVVAMHIQMHSEDGSLRITREAADGLEKIFKGYQSVNLYTAHTHILYNIDKFSSDHYFEHNAGAVCGTWWWTNEETPGVHIGQDGSPGGYNVLNVSGKDVTWQFKGTGYPIDYQFRTYDRNNICITSEKYVPSASKEYKTAFENLMKSGSRWATESQDNEVYINVWNYDPQWKVEVSEDGVPLVCEKVNDYDPLHLISYTTKNLNRNVAPSFATVKTSHFFKVTASSPTSTLDIKVTDRFGNIYTESMSRPKAFDTDTYRK